MPESSGRNFSEPAARFHLVDATTPIARIRSEMASRSTTWVGVCQGGVLIGTVGWDQLRNCADPQKAVETLIKPEDAQLRWAA